MDVLEAFCNTPKMVAEHGLSPEDAYLLCSLCVDLRISEIVDAGQYVVSALLPLAIFADA